MLFGHKTEFVKLVVLEIFGCVPCNFYIKSSFETNELLNFHRPEAFLSFLKC